jgi:hypothetical protein
VIASREIGVAVCAGGAGEGEDRRDGRDLEAVALFSCGQAGADAFVVADEAPAGDAFELVVVDEPGIE